MRKYIAQKFHKARPFDYAGEPIEERRFWTAAGLLKFVRKEVKHYPKDPRTTYQAIVIRRGREVELFRF